jgi:hypothetical protein
MNKNYNLGIDPNSIEHNGEEDGDFEKILNLVKQKADPSIIQAEWLRKRRFLREQRVAHLLDERSIFRL